MSTLSQQEDGATMVAEKTEVYLDWSVGNQIQGNITTGTLPKHLLLSSVHRKKILEIRRQLDEDTYDIDQRLDVALDRLLEYLIG